MAHIVSIEYKRRDGAVLVTDSDGNVSEYALDDFDKPASQEQILASYAAPPEPDPTPEQKLERLQADYDKMKAALVSKTTITEDDLKAAALVDAQP